MYDNSPGHRHTYHAQARYSHDHDGQGYHIHDDNYRNGAAVQSNDAWSAKLANSQNPDAQPAKLHAPTSPITLDPNDPFDAALIPIVETNRRKRKDYAKDGDPFSNFRTTANMLGVDGFGPAESAFFNVLQKVARLQSLRVNGRMTETANESVTDTYLDLAVYAIILYAIVLQGSDYCED